MTALRSVVARIAAAIRCVGVAYIVVQVVIWQAFYSAELWRLAGPVTAAVWGLAAAAFLRRRWPVWQLAGIDTGVYVALALSAGWCVPPAMRGAAASWLFIAMASQLIVPAWFTPATVFVSLILASDAAYSGGLAVTSAAGARDSIPAATAALLLAAAAMHWCFRRLLYRRFTRTDIALSDADRDARDQYVVLTRNIERREHERLLHDTVLNTLTALAHTGGNDSREVVGRCRHDISLIEDALSDPDNPSAATASPYGDVVSGIEAVAVEMRTRGLVINFEVSSGVPAESGTPVDTGAAAGTGDAPVVPVSVAATMASAVREALANVASHAGTGEAWVEVSLTAPGADAAASGGLLVTVRDVGAGFDPARVDPARLGLRRSITERLADCGGQAFIRSAPGQGTLVSLSWIQSQPPSQTVLAGHASDRGARPW
jgi:signal transduction histidine kinase